ncbi:MAG TPA: 5-amino-6-(D-ribitylamino)uracil--L-tyrosine 4-hydroxyphenyl transferase CofH [Methanotrichaceae archaeon]|nr:5-amino-6-(D-ribitylamino)uracil--L-tyrosine 4-hydroxyphenyl transferase CofH [Methanotrichaceae archaeon]
MSFSASSIVGATHNPGPDHDAHFSDLSMPLSRDDLLGLWHQPMRLFRLANDLRQRSCGNYVSYVINRNINFTNRCVGSCRFCAFHRSDGYMLTSAEILDRVGSAHDLGATEICLQGGLAPGMVLEDYCAMLELICRDYPQMHLHAYSPMEVLYMSRNSGLAIEDTLPELKRSGLGSMPGTAAEILVDSIRAEICPGKLKTEEWCRVITAAHRLGIPTTSTMLYGHVESMDDRLKHLQVLREIQASTHGFTEFVLLPFIPGNNDLGPFAHAPDLLDHLKMHALARVALYPLITNIQSSWTKLGREVAGATIEWGVNDLGGTLMEENISRSAGAREAQYLSPDELRSLIARHGRSAFQRTTLYQRV